MIMTEEQLHALETLYKIIAEAYWKVISSQETVIMTGIEAEEPIGQWEILTGDCLREISANISKHVGEKYIQALDASIGVKHYPSIST